MNKKKRVAMIGLGAMGTALAKSLLENKIEIHIWNRSPNKTEVLEQKGASTHLKPHNAIELCDLVVICLSNYDAWKVIVDDEKTQTSGKTTGNGPDDYTHKIEVNSTTAGATSISNREYESRLQDKKRLIKLLDTRYLDTFLEEFITLIRK